jgi:1,2-phenylacetyl-CoA epoxidase PaaB subunit
MAIENARDVYTRRNEGISIWVVESKFIHASNPSESDSLFDPANDKLIQVTSLKHTDIKWLSGKGKELVYEWNGNLYTLDPASGKSENE